MSDLQAVPDIGDESVVPADEEITPSDVDQVYDVLEKQNVQILGRLQMLGKTVNPLLLLKLEHDTLLDFVMGDEQARRQYDTAVGLRLNETLKTIYAQAVGAEVDG